MKTIIISTFFFVLAVLSPAMSAAAGDPDQNSPKSMHYRAVGGIISDATTGEPIGHVTVQAAGMAMATKANRDGRYRLVLPAGQYQLDVSHVGYYSQAITVNLADSSVTCDIRLKPAVVDMGERQVFSRAYDPAQRIIAQAIAHKKDILSRIHDYHFDASSKIVLRNTTKPDSQSVFLIAESQSTCFWEQPNKFKQIITSRRQTANIPAEGNLVGVGALLNFNENRLDFGEQSIVSPTATDAMEHYNYYLLDTVYLDNRPVYVLEIEPKNEYEPLFAGTLHIVDSTFDVVKVDVAFSKGVSLPFIKNGRLSQSLAPINGEYWLPVEIGYAGDIEFNVPIPSVPKRMSFDYVASIYSYQVETGHPDKTFDEYELVVAPEADDVDSAAWDARQTIPLTASEQYGYRRLDSLEHRPESIPKVMLKGLAAAMLLATMGPPEFFHFNRVEGAYLGVGLRKNDLVPKTRLRAKAGYAFEDKNWQYAFGVGFRIWEKRRFEIGMAVKDEIVHRPTIISSASYNPTLYALMFKVDPFDYFHERGVEASASIKPLSHTRLQIGYRDLRQSSKPKQTDYSLFRRDIPPRDNPGIADGTLRSVSIVWSCDSRGAFKNKNGEEIRVGSRYFQAQVGIEHAAPSFIDNDFDFRRFYLTLDGRFDCFGMGRMSAHATIGSSDGDLPPQRFFIADFHSRVLYGEEGFNTFKETNFAGDRIALVHLDHDFGPFVFRNSGIGPLKKIPVGLSLYGAALWTEFHRQPRRSDPTVHIAPTAYTEVGFGLTNLTPFLLPFNFAVYFSWQLSDYDTRRFECSLGLTL
jgi:hypothetical protein